MMPWLLGGAAKEKYSHEGLYGEGISFMTVLRSMHFAVAVDGEPLSSFAFAFTVGLPNR